MRPIFTYQILKSFPANKKKLAVSPPGLRKLPYDPNIFDHLDKIKKKSPSTYSTAGVKKRLITVDRSIKRG